MHYNTDPDNVKEIPSDDVRKQEEKRNANENERWIKTNGKELNPKSYNSLFVLNGIQCVPSVTQYTITHPPHYPLQYRN